MATKPDPQKLEEILTRGVHKVFTRKEVEEMLLSGDELHLKLGTDVTGANLTLGHAVVHRKLRDFQELGHKVTLIIGDFTTLVGDHSDKVDMRKEADIKEMKEFEKSWTKQFFKTVYKDQTEIRHNSEWLKSLDFNDVIGLAKQFTLQQMFDREAYLMRYKNKKPIGMDEFLYPLMQGYDSVALDCNIEFGGTDQTFNILAGRKLMPVFKQKPQSAFIMRLLTGNDGRPMGKSLKNFVPILDNPTNMYGKLMSIVDDIIIEYFELITRIPMKEVKEMENEMKAGKVNPMELKKILAHDVVTFYHSKNEADMAANNFKSNVQDKQVDAESIPELKVSERKMTLRELVILSKLAPSNSEAKRLISQNAVTLDDLVRTNAQEVIKVRTGQVLKVGKRKYVKIVKV